MAASFPRYSRGTLVRALKHIDFFGADVPPETLGVVFEEAEFHESSSGPMVRWMNGGACNVYDGDTRIAEEVKP